MSLVQLFKSIFVYSVIILLLGCIAEDKKKEDTPTNSQGNPVDNTALALNGFWKGGFDQKDTLKVLIYNGDVYALDADKGFFGTVVSPKDEEVDFKLTSYPLSYTDKPNLEFVAGGTATTYTINGLLASKKTIVGDFETGSAVFGALTINNDETFTNNSSFTALAGKWTTANLELNITSKGRFHGVNNGTGKNCSYEGQFTIIKPSESLLSFSMNRRNCDDFNGDSTGFAAINGDKKLELYGKMGTSLLFMTFNPPAAASTTPTTNPTTPPATTPTTPPATTPAA